MGTMARTALTALRRARRARALAAAEVGASARPARRSRRDAARRRPDAGPSPREARALHGGRSALAAPAALRRARAGEADLRSLRRRGGRHRRRRPLGDEPSPRAAEDPHRAGRRRDGRDQGDVVQPAVARGEARRGHDGPDPRPCEPSSASPSRRTTSTASPRPATSRLSTRRPRTSRRRSFVTFTLQALERVRDVG